ncbi:hypothetical protein PHYPO_G00155840 [Pangasianodon hypophthalmus]|uniref:Immunoglobulin domain-containing protein n=1 Tax=Pangasianodon hypophthalmus TaxID=310915 RepID=A0A5N5K1W6_PANHP|nr:hypothetical protein PHYPO_G00155840 [Pangasianodon hypophthalmus]
MLLIFTLYLISAQVDCEEDVKVTGYEGGSVIINYKYNPQKYNNHTKYFCKINKRNCKNIFSQTKEKWDLKGKFFAVDEIPAGVYSVLIRNLSQEDGGNYRFGVEDQNENLLNVELDVENGLYYGKSFSQTTHPGDVVTFSCTYPEGHENDMKSVYKVTSQSIFAIIFTYSDYENKDKYVLHVSSRDKVINMSISNVTVDDGGLYLCGVLKNKPSYVSIFSEMQLEVTAPASSSAIIITVYVGVALLLIAGFTLIFYKLWSTKAKDASSPADRGNPVNREGAYSAYYEKIQDTQAATVYVSAQKPQTHPIFPNLSGRTATSTT